MFLDIKDVRNAKKIKPTKETDVYSFSMVIVEARIFPEACASRF